MPNEHTLLDGFTDPKCFTRPVNAQYLYMLGLWIGRVGTAPCLGEFLRQFRPRVPFDLNNIPVTVLVILGRLLCRLVCHFLVICSARSICSPRAVTRSRAFLNGITSPITRLSVIQSV